METNVTEKTRELIDRWIRAKNNVKRFKDELSRAECEESNASNELGKWLVPEDFKEGEQFNIWFGSGIIQAFKSHNSYKISWRKEPDGKDKYLGV